MGFMSKIEDKLSGNKDNTQEGVDSSRSYDNTTGGMTGQGSHLQQQTGSAYPTHGTTTTSNNPLSSNADPNAGSGISGGTHPLVSGDNTTTGMGLGNDTRNTTGYSSGQGSHLAGSTDQYSSSGFTGTGLNDSRNTSQGLNAGSGIDNTPYSGSGLSSNTHHTGSVIGGTQHSDRGLTGTSHTGQGLGRDTGYASSGIGSNTTDTGLTGTGSRDQRSVDFVPGSHPSANNHSAIPTAGGQRVGGVGETGYSGNDAGVHQTMSDKAKNALPGQHGNAHDEYGNPINSSSTGAHNTGGLTGSNTVYNNQPGSAYPSSAQPLSRDSEFNDRHSGPGVGTGLAAGAVGGAGLADAEHHHNSRNQTGSGYNGGLAGTRGGYDSAAPGSYQQDGRSGLTGSDNYSSTTGTGRVGEDHRGMMDKAKDALSSKRSNHPDDPISGTNYDQKNRDQYTQGTQGSNLTGSEHGNYARTSGTQEPGVAGITSGVGQTHLGSSTHSGRHNDDLARSHGVGHEGRSSEWKEGYAAGYREAMLSTGSHSSSHTGTHSGSHIGSHDKYSSATGQQSGNYADSTGAYSSTAGSGYGEKTKPSMMDKLNPKKDADFDGKAGIMD